MKWNEDTWVRWLQRQVGTNPHVPLGIGDDCALVSHSGKNLVLKTDAVVDGVHFDRSMPLKKVGRKALARVLSDFASMGAVPQYALVSLGVPRSEPLANLQELYRGLLALAKTWNVQLVGGETTRCDTLWLSVSATGTAKRVLARSTAQAGDLIYVTGVLGGTLASGHHLSFTPRLKEGQWLAQQSGVNAMMDISDGLGHDLPRMAQASRLSYHLEPKLLPCRKGCTPQQAVNDGEDYELLFSVHPRQAKSLEKQWQFKTRLTCIGRFLPASQPSTSCGLPMQGWDHFANLILK